MANLNPAWAEEAVRLFEGGKNVTETAALVGASISTVGTVLREHGCDTRRSRAGKQWRTPRVACPICGKPFLPCLTRKTCSVSCRKQRGSRREIRRADAVQDSESAPAGEPESAVYLGGNRGR